MPNGGFANVAQGLLEWHMIFLSGQQNTFYDLINVLMIRICKMGTNSSSLCRFVVQRCLA
jgi:hypothetical protein